MTNAARTHVLDTSVFIQAHRSYYPFDVCPGFWECLTHHAQAQRIISIDRVLDEIRAGKDELKTWASKRALRPFFAATDEPAVVAEYGAMMEWVQASTLFLEAAKAEFANVADGWVAAYAKAHGLTLVAQEVLAPDARKRVPLPNVCREFGVPWINSFELLRALGSRFDWKPPLAAS